MARKPMVTRTFTTTEVNALCLNLETCEPFNKAVSLARTYSDDKKLEKVLASMLNTETEKFVHVVDKQEVEKLYGMDENVFLQYATELDPETRKALATEETADAQ